MADDGGWACAALPPRMRWVASSAGSKADGAMMR